MTTYQSQPGQHHVGDLDAPPPYPGQEPPAYPAAPVYPGRHLPLLRRRSTPRLRPIRQWRLPTRRLRLTRERNRPRILRPRRPTRLCCTRGGTGLFRAAGVPRGSGPPGRGARIPRGTGLPGEEPPAYPGEPPFPLAPPTPAPAADPLPAYPAAGTPVATPTAPSETPPAPLWVPELPPQPPHPPAAAPGEQDDLVLQSGRKHLKARQRGVDGAAFSQLVVALPMALISLVVVAVVSSMIPLAGAFVPLVWLLSGPLVFNSRVEAVIARRLLGMRRPEPADAQRLAEVWGR